MDAAFGSVSAGGLGTPSFDVTQRGGGPSRFVASQFAGNAGGVTPSKFSLTVIRLWHPHGPSLRASRGPSATPAVVSKKNKNNCHTPVTVTAAFIFAIMTEELQQPS
jgi:hypothetical protein